MDPADPMVLLRDVAKYAGVSLSTASRALNDDGGSISAETQARVRAAARALGYRPRRVRSSGRRGSLYRVAVVFSYHLSISNYHSIEALLRSVAASPVLTPVPVAFNFASIEAALEELAELEVAAALVTGFAPAVVQLFGALDPSLPVALFNHSENTLPAFRATGRQCIGAGTDRAAGNILAVNHLASLGHGRIAVSIIDVGTEKFQGYQQAMSAHELPITDDLLLGADLWPEIPGPDLGRQTAEQLLRMEDPPTAVICANDEIAMGLMSRVHQAGWRIPRDLSVIGWDGIDIGAYAIPPLTTVAQPYQAVAEHCVKALTSWLETGAPPPCAMTPVQPSLILRGSTGPAPDPKFRGRS